MKIQRSARKTSRTRSACVTVFFNSFFIHHCSGLFGGYFVILFLLLNFFFFLKICCFFLLLFRYYASVIAILIEIQNFVCFGRCPFVSKQRVHLASLKTKTQKLDIYTLQIAMIPVQHNLNFHKIKRNVINV